MDLTYKNDKLKNLCENPEYNNEILKKYGKDVANKLPLRIKQLKGFQTLNDVPITKPFRRHKLIGNRSEQFKININDEYRIILKHVEDNKIIISDLSKINKVEILEVSKHYE